MPLRKLISQIGAKYDRQLPMSSEAHRLLRQAENEFKQWVPAGFLIEGGGGKDRPAETPGIAILDPAETTTTRNGIYVIYLFAADLSTVTLTLNQGVSEMADYLGRDGAREVLAVQAARMRAALRPKDIANLDITFDLRTTAASSVDYEHANIVSLTYSLDSLPAESEMVSDLQRFTRLYGLALAAREEARKHGRHELITRVRPPQARKPAEPAAAPVPEPAAEPVGAPAAQPVGAPAAQPVGAPAAQPVGAPKAQPVAAPQPVAVAEKAVPELGTTLEKLETDTTAQRKLKTLTRPMTRRGVLAALVAAPIAYAAPKAVPAAQTQIQHVVTRTPLRAQTAPVFTIDVSQHDWRRRGGNLDWLAIRHAGIAGMCARATYGDPSGYQWPTHHFGSFARAARNAGLNLRGGYHNLVRGDQASINRQVDWLRRELDRYDANWAMLDVERYSELVKADMWPTWDDVRRFDDRWEDVDDRVLVGYIPPWNWSKHLGMPDLRAFRGPLIASNYPREANEEYRALYDSIGGNDGRGWAEYGNRVPEGWQYTSRAKVPGVSQICDVNAWRITYEELKVLLTTRPVTNIPPNIPM